MNFRLAFIIGLLFSIHTSSSAQSIYNSTGYWDNYQIRTLTMEDGMPGEQVYYVQEDSLGFIWVANIYGLVRYDGLSLKTYTSGYVGGSVYEIHQNSDGNFLIPTIGQGMYEFDGSHMIQYKDELPSESGFVKSLAYTSNNISYLGLYGDGVALFDGEKVIKHIPSDSGLVGDEVWKIIEDRDGRIWAGTNQGLSIIEGDKIINFTEDNGLPYSTIRGLTEMSNGDVWVGTDKEGIVIFRDQQPDQYLHSKDGLSGLFPQYFAEHPFDGSIWIAHHGSGLDVYRNGNIETITEQDGLLSDYLTFVGFSEDGTAYIGHETGMSVLTERKVQTIDEETDGVFQTAIVTVNQSKDGAVWLGTDGNGFSYLSDDSWEVLEYPPNITNGYASTSAIDPDGNIWFSTQGTGIVKIENQKITNHISTDDGLINDFARGMDFDNEGTLWLGTNEGLNIIRNQGESIESITTENGLANNFSMVVKADSKGGVWHGSYGGGVTHLLGENISIYDTSNGLGSNFVFSMLEDLEGRLLIGSASPGVSYFKNGVMHYFGYEAGFPVGNISGMDVAANGDIWCATNNGVFTFNAEHLDEILEGQRTTIEYTQLSREDGLSSIIYETGNGTTVRAMDNGEILFASVNGADILHPDRISFDSDSFFPYIDDFMVDEIILDKTNLRELTPDDAKIEISYSALNIQSPKKTKFRIRLDGIDDQWVYVEDRQTAYYDYLPDGDYEFHVSAIGPDGQWSRKTASINFTVLPPFYKTWWFISLCLIGFGGLIAGAVQIRSNLKVQALNRELETQQKIHTERERISRDLHDNVGSQITNLITGLEISQLHFQKNEPDKAMELLSDLDADARGAMTELRETIWLMNKDEIPASVFIDHLKGYVRRQSRYLPNTKTLVTSDSKCDKLLKPAESLNLMRIIQEALNNTKKYAEADTFKVNCSQKGTKMELTISDNGKGMDVQSSLTLGNGLSNMKHRAKEIHADFNVVSEPGKGTTIYISM
jgi:signal transduction histidine kinase/ligand-binding sensor domain-containing protein